MQIKGQAVWLIMPGRWEEMGKWSHGTMATNKEQTSGGMMPGKDRSGKDRPGKDRPGKDRPAPDLSRSLRYVVIYLCLAVAMLLSGLQHFVLTLPSASGKQLQYTDGIVVMTGGQQRLDDGLQLLTDGIAGKMLISGVGDGVSRAVLVQQLDLDEREINALFCCVELDFVAKDTRGNARVARRWAIDNNMRSLRLVTANYHMPRALLVFANEMPEFNLYQYPVYPDDLRIDGWWHDRAMLRLLIREYAKYLAETVRI